MNKPVKIVTDSACDLPEAIVASAGIEIVPLTIRFGEEEFTDRQDLSPSEFWRRTAQASDLPSTAAPSPGSFEAAFLKAANSGAEGVVCITLASKLSATFQAATTGAAMVKDIVDVRVIDSETCTVSEGTLCIEAAASSGRGATLDEVVVSVENLKPRLRLFGALDTVENLRKGGRIGAAGAMFASLLAVKPVITIEGGEVKPKARQRTRSRALRYLAGLVTEHGSVEHVRVAHSGAPDVAEFLEMLRPVVDPKSVMVADIGPTIGVHGGPRLIAVSFATTARATT